MYRTDDPARDFENYDRDRQRRLERYPMCECCGERIHSEKLYYIDGRFFCEECIDDCHEWTDKYIEE
jgi:RNA polymerase-binding transcription factor DksA